MKIFDTLSEKEISLDLTKLVKIYLCGVTVYDESHIGHARTIIVFDSLRRFLEANQLRVQMVQNFTDVDDKIINRAKDEKTTALQISSKFIEHYFDDFDRLNVKRVDKYPKATENILDMINLIRDLVEKKCAYVTKNGVYFSVTRFPEYGKLSKKKIDDLISGARIEIDETKNEPLDFALWKFSNEDPNWPSPWGKGRPGWHIECSAMSLKYLGETFDIHGGGRDLIFPHHENEIAQSESHTGKIFAKIWMHVGMVTINDEKMSKSLGNIKSVKYVLKNWGPNVIRLFCLSTHYSKPIDYSEELLKECVIKWRQIENCYYELILADGDSSIDEIKKIVEETRIEFNDALNTDFNTPLALISFFKLTREINKIASSETLSKSIAKYVLPEFEKMLEILGLIVQKMSNQENIMVMDLITKRNRFREQKNYVEADQMRKQLSDLDIVLIDHKNRTLWMKQERINYES